MIKIFNISIRLIFNHCIGNNIYPCRWKKANVVLILTKNDKQTLKKNNRPVYLLPIGSKIFERLAYNKMFGFSLGTGLISANQ